MLQLEKEREKAKKKLSIFFDATQSPLARSQAFVSFSTNATEDDVSRAFKDHYYMIYQVFLDSWNTYEVAYRRGKGAAPENEILKLGVIPKRLFQYFPDKLKQGWQIGSLMNIIEKLLLIENVHSVRLMGIRLLLSLLAIVQRPTSRQQSFLTSSIDFFPFTRDYPDSSGIYLTTKVLSSDTSKLFIPVPRDTVRDPLEKVNSSNTTSTPTVQYTTHEISKTESADVFETILNFAVVKIDDFTFWFELVKSLIFPIIYPNVCKKIGLLPEKEHSGFQSGCPYDFQVILIYQLNRWFTSYPKIVDYFLCPVVTQSSSNLEESFPNITLLLEILRQGCLLPLNYPEVIKKVMSIANQIFLTNLDPDNVLTEDLFNYQKFLFEQIQHVLEIETGPFEKEHELLGLFIHEQVFQGLIEVYGTLKPKTQQLFLNALINTNTSLLKKSNPNTFLKAKLGAISMRTLLFGFIKSKEKNPAMWTRLRTELEALFYQPEVFIQLRILLMQMTLLIKECVYPISEKKAQRKLKKDAKYRNDGKSQDSNEIPKDPAIAKLSLEVDDVIDIWQNLVDLLLHINSVKEPAIQESGIQILVDVMDTLLNAEDDADFKKSSNVRSLSLVEIFGPRIFEACNLDSKFIKGKAIAFGGLCRLLIRDHAQFSLKLLSYFYTVINTGMFTSATSGIDLTHHIIVNTSDVFSRSIIGANVLIPSYMYRIKYLLKTSNIPLPLEVSQKAISILCSLICYPNHLGPLEIPTQMDKGKLVGKSLVLSEMKNELADLLISIEKTEKNVENKMMCLCGIAVMMVDEIVFLSEKGPVNCNGLVEELFKALVHSTKSSDPLISRIALDGISTLLLIHTHLSSQFVSDIIMAILNNIVKSVSEGSQPVPLDLPETVIAHHYQVLLDWVAIKPDIFDEDIFAPARTLLFHVIQLGLEHKIEEEQKTLPPTKAQELTTSKTFSIPRLSKAVATEEDDIEKLEKLDTIVPIKINVIQEAAEILLTHTLNFVHNFPPKLGSEVLSSQMEENDDREGSTGSAFVCVLNESTLLAVVDVKDVNTNQTFARVFVRDATGKYVWNFETNTQSSQVISKVNEIISNLQIAETQGQNEKIEKTDIFNVQQTTPSEETNYVAEVIRKLKEKYPECVEQSTPLNPKFIEEIKTAEQQIINFLDGEINYVNKPIYIIPPNPQVGLSPSHFSRLLLSHLGFLGLARFPRIQLLDTSSKFGRALTQLDTSPSREILKIGIIYVADGQDDQNDILFNDTATPLYKEFVNGLGYPVELSTHRGYMGGLDRKLNNGPFAPYYSTSTIEVIFHDITLMPSVQSDPQQIQKKKHVGNDIVHIIWSEHPIDYSPNTITSQFNDAHIVVYPLQNGLFRIQIFRKSKVPLFGPTLNGMAIPKRLLPILVRLTAINAYRYIRHSTAGYSKPYTVRKQRIKEIVERYSTNSEYFDVLQSIIQPIQAAPTPGSTNEPLSD